jgi:bifunctional non-homologous end joining protein LigD
VPTRKKAAAKKTAAAKKKAATKKAAAPKKRLARYQSMRDFSKTAEPSGASDPPDPGPGNRFVVQRHRARALHYDLRLEMDGVLASWAVPKGPTLDPKARRLAVHVEDHPLDYFDFEGVIPGGEYGGGDVIVWDWGTWTSGKEGEEPVQAVIDGEIHFDLHGEKLAGGFVLFRTDRNGDKNWMLIHRSDEHAVAGWDAGDHLQSVKSGLTNDEVKAAPPDMWTRDRPPGPTPAELAALDDLGAKGEWTFQGRTLKLTNLDKVLFPARPGEQPVTKRDLIRYHAEIAPWMLPYLEGRPLNTHRYPDGVDKPGFWFKAYPSHAPDWLARWYYEDHGKGETEWYTVVDSPPGLAWMANYGSLELHPWTSTTDAPHEPTWAYIDIDPGPNSSWDDVLVLARLYKAALEHLEVQAGAKVTGQRGIQMWVPIARGCTFDETRTWVEGISRAIGATVPDMVSWAWTKSDRGGKARLDYTQNAINKTLVAPFSARPAPGAPVSVPIEWDELDDPDLAPDRWTIRTVLDRVHRVGDPLRHLIGVQQHLPPT